MNARALPGQVDAVVVGGGHAGLAMSNVLTGHGVEHVVLERGEIGERWCTERWDSLRLLTPNWATWLPGWRYTGPEPDGFMHRTEVARYLADYAASFGAPVHPRVEVRSVARHDGSPGAGRFQVRTTAGDVVSRNVVIATGPFQAPRLPRAAGEVPPDVRSLHSTAYGSPEALPPGAVLVVGTGASGQQIADELVAAGRKVYVSVGRHRRVPRRYRGRDYFWWLENTGFYAKTAADVPLAERRGGASPAITGGRGGNHDLDLRRLAAEGATLLGRIRGIQGHRLELAPDLGESIAQGDRAYEQFVQWVEARLELPGEPVGEPEARDVHPDPPEMSHPPTGLDLREAGITGIVWATGFEPAFEGWVRLGVLDADGHPVHERGVTACPGAYFLGLHWLHRLRSAFIRGAEEDARHLGEHITRERGTGRPAAAA